MTNVGKLTVNDKVYLVQRASVHEGRQVYIDAMPLEQYPAALREKARDLVRRREGRPCRNR